MIRILLLGVVLLFGSAAVLPAQVRLGVGVRAGAVHGSVVLGGGRLKARYQARPRLVVPGRHVVRHRTAAASRRVWVRGYWETVPVPAVYEWRIDSCGRRYRVLVQPACSKRIWHPGYWRTVGHGVCR